MPKNPWDKDLESLLASSNGLCDSGMIFGKDGAMWCSTDHENALKITGDEAKRIGRELGNQDFSMKEGGLQVNGTVYLPIGEEGDVFVGLQGEEYVHMHATNSCVIITHCTSKDAPNHEVISEAVRSAALSLIQIGL